MQVAAAVGFPRYSPSPTLIRPHYHDTSGEMRQAGGKVGCDFEGGSEVLGSERRI